MTADSLLLCRSCELTHFARKEWLGVCARTAAADLGSLKVTKPKPLLSFDPFDFVGSIASVSSPYFVKYSLNSSKVVSAGIPPTNSFRMSRSTFGTGF